MISLLETYGPTDPTTLVEPVGTSGRGVFIEEATTNLVPNPSFEVNLTGWIPAGTTFAPTITRSTTRAYSGPAGAASALISWPTGANSGNSGYANTAVSVVSGTSYTFTAWVWTTDTAVQLSVYGAGLGAGSAQSAFSTVTARWQRLSVTFTATATGAITLQLSPTTVTTATTTYLDAVQLEAKAYATSYADGSLGLGYAWTGTANASTSTRAAGQLQHPIPTMQLNAITVCTWSRVGIATTSIYADIANTATIDIARLAVSGTGIVEGSRWVAGVQVFANASLGTIATGDQLFVAMTYNGATVSAYGSKNGGALATGSAAATGTAALTSASVGYNPFNGAAQANGGLEQLLVYKAALTLAQITALAFGREQTYADDPQIVYRLNGRQADTAAGSGKYRVTRTINANDPTLVSARTYRFTVPAGSGVGVGQLLTWVDPARGPYGTVTSVSAPPGQPEVLTVTENWS